MFSENISRVTKRAPVHWAVNWLTGLALLWLVVGTEAVDSSVTQENRSPLVRRLFGLLWIARVTNLTWRYNKRLSRGHRERNEKLWFYDEREHFKASLGLGYVLCRLGVFSTAGFRIRGMATPRISWDVFVPSLLQTGTQLTRWEEVNRSPSVFNSYTILCDEKVKESGCCGEPLEATQVCFRTRDSCSSPSDFAVIRSLVLVLKLIFFRFPGVQCESRAVLQCRQIWLLFCLERRRKGT